ncbi:MAG: hypothetical protein AMXMBFR84_20110 [Candidatus Hydrogenedentota bacterium]
MNPYYAVATALYCTVIWIASANPDLSPAELPLEGLDKVIHMVEYAVLATLVSLGMRRSRRGWSEWALCFGPMFFALAYGTVDEIHQLFVPNREFDLGDIVANFAGGALAQSVLCYFWGRRTKPEPPIADRTRES